VKKARKKKRERSVLGARVPTQYFIVQIEQNTPACFKDPHAKVAQIGRRSVSRYEVYTGIRYKTQ
jgi:hypothetical protein